MVVKEEEEAVEVTELVTELSLKEELNQCSESKPSL